jgi:hypothetical protein
MHSPDALRASDAAVVARFLQLRSLLHDRHLGRVERLILERFVVQSSKHIPSTFAAHVRTSFIRPGEGDLCPVIFTTTVDLSLALCIELSPQRVADLGTTLNGPRRIRHRGWEDWWGWEKPLSQLSGFYDLDAAAQEEAIASWFAEPLDWMADNGLLRRRS